MPFLFLLLVFSVMLKTEVILEVLDKVSNLFLDVGKGLKFDLMKEVKCARLWRHMP
jgi:hypothetical protein